MTNYFKATFFLFVLGLSLPMLAADKSAGVRCVEKGEAGFFVVGPSGKIAGSPAYGFGDNVQCQQAIRESLNGPFVCSWNGKTFQIFNVNNGIGYGNKNIAGQYEDLETCAVHAKLQIASKPVMCAWNGRSYIPYNVSSGVALSNENSGWEDIGQCVKEASAKSTLSAVCGWDAADYVYALEGTKIDFKFKNTDSCSSFLAVLNRGQKLSSLISTLKKADFSGNEPVAAFVSSEPDKKVGFANQKKCEVAEDAYHLTKAKDGYLVEGCRPDTLYSWGDFDKLNWFLSNLKNNETWMNELPRSLFTTTSAAATFGYGPMPLRFKIKPAVKFKTVPTEVSNCEAVLSESAGTKKDFQSTIYQRLTNRADGFSFVDYIICSPKVIESYSFAMPEHFDEILKDAVWMTTENYYNWEGYSKQNGQDVFLNNRVDAGKDLFSTDFTAANFNREMKLLRSIISNKAGQIVTEKGGSTESHFKTRWPIYFNPQ